MSQRKFLIKFKCTEILLTLSTLWLALVHEKLSDENLSVLKELTELKSNFRSLNIIYINKNQLVNHAKLII